jgi:hypothetical protein
MNVTTAILLPLATLTLASCGPRTPPAPAPAPVPVAAPVFAHADVWTRTAGVALQRDSGEAVVVPHGSMRLQVLRADTGGMLRVRCLVCVVPVDGRVRMADVVYEPRSPAEAATDSLAVFVLAIREAARRHDVPGLRAVMSPSFVHAADGPDGILEAVGAWEAYAYRVLDRVPGLLDRGVVPVPGTDLWTAPPASAAATGYPQLRAGFRRRGTRWEWIYLLQGGDVNGGKRE